MEIFLAPLAQNKLCLLTRISRLNMWLFCILLWEPPYHSTAPPLHLRTVNEKKWLCHSAIKSFLNFLVFTQNFHLFIGCHYELGTFPVQFSHSFFSFLCHFVSIVFYCIFHVIRSPLVMCFVLPSNHNSILNWHLNSFLSINFHMTFIPPVLV